MQTTKKINAKNGSSRPMVCSALGGEPRGDRENPRQQRLFTRQMVLADEHADPATGGARFTRGVLYKIQA